jgi:excisionase family DNA binding protein
MKGRATPVNGVLLDVKSAAAYLGGNERWLRRLLERGVVPCRRIGRNVFFKPSELEEFVDALPGITPRQARFNANKKQAASG